MVIIMCKNTDSWSCVTGINIILLVNYISKTNKQKSEKMIRFVVTRGKWWGKENWIKEVKRMWTQVGLRKPHYEQSEWRWWNSVELLQILKNGAVKVLHSISQQTWKTEHWHRTGKGPSSFQSQRKAMPKNAQTTTQLHSSHTLAK